MEVLDTEKVAGRINDYKYVVKQLGQELLIFFMDTSEQGENFRIVLFVSIVIALLCWIILLVIVLLLSGRVIRPVLIGMEKQKQFITNAGHEMKTPLLCLIATTFLLSGCYFTEEKIEDTQIIFSDNQITVDGEEITNNKTQAVYSKKGYCILSCRSRLHLR